MAKHSAPIEISLQDFVKEHRQTKTCELLNLHQASVSKMLRRGRDIYLQFDELGQFKRLVEFKVLVEARTSIESVA